MICRPSLPSSVTSPGLCSSVEMEHGGRCLPGPPRIPWFSQRSTNIWLINHQYTTNIWGFIWIYGDLMGFFMGANQSSCPDFMAIPRGLDWSQKSIPRPCFWRSGNVFSPQPSDLIWLDAVRNQDLSIHRLWSFSDITKMNVSTCINVSTSCWPFDTAHFCFFEEKMVRNFRPFSAFTQATGSTRAAETDVRSTSSGCITVHSLHSVLVAMGQIVEWPCGLRFVGFSMSIHFNCGSQKHRIMMSWFPTNVHHRWAPSPQLVGQMPISLGIKSFDVGCDFFSHDQWDTKFLSIREPFGSGSKPCTPGEHKNSW